MLRIEIALMTLNSKLQYEEAEKARLIRSLKDLIDNIDATFAIDDIAFKSGRLKEVQAEIKNINEQIALLHMIQE